MAFIPTQQVNTGFFVSTTFDFDIQALQGIEGISPELRELLIRLYLNLNKSLLALNQRDVGMFQLQEQLNGQVWFNPISSNINDSRYGFGKAVNFGALPNAGLKSVPHGINFNTITAGTDVWGAAFDPVGKTMIPLPYASPTLVNNIELYLDATNVNIITGSNRSNYTQCYVVAQWLKN